MSEIKKEQEIDKTMELYSEFDKRIERLERIVIGVIKDIRIINKVIIQGHTEALRNVIPLIENIEEELRRK